MNKCLKYYVLTLFYTSCAVGNLYGTLAATHPKFTGWRAAFCGMGVIFSGVAAITEARKFAYELDQDIYAIEESEEL